MIKLFAPWVHAQSGCQIFRHFDNPWAILLMRLGFVRIPYFPYRIRKGRCRYTMLARPTTTMMADLFILRDVLINETYRDVLSLLPKRGIRMLDIGANLGSFTVWLDKEIGLSEAFCFEPEEDSFRLLNFNLALNGCTMARTIQGAVGGESRRTMLALKQSSPGGTTLYADYTQNSAAKQVSVVAFREWLSGVEGNFDLLKMDCESAEWEILDKTDPEQFKRFRVLLAEVHFDPVRGRPVGQFKPLAEGLGYRTVRWDNKNQGLYVGIRQ